MANTSQTTVLARLSFPPYVVSTLSERHVLLAGGGGSSRTGVGNRLEVYKLLPGERRTQCIAKTETGDEALMNGVFFNHDKTSYFAGGGIKGICNILQITQRLSTIDDQGEQQLMTAESYKNTSTTTSNSSNLNSYANGYTNGDSSLTYRGKTNGHVHHNGLNGSNGPLKETDDLEHKEVIFKFEPSKSFQCDFHPNGENESFLKSVKFVPSSNVLVTGGADGHFRIWSFPSLKKLIDVKGHNDEICDMDVSCDGQFMCTVSRDGISQLWKLNDGSKLTQLQFNAPTKSPVKYKFKFCRFHPKQCDVFFTVIIPVILKTTDPSYIIRWNAGTRIIESFSTLTVPKISCLNIR